MIIVKIKMNKQYDRILTSKGNISMTKLKKGVYRLYETENGRTFYIGRTLDSRRRKNEHVRGARNGSSELKYVHIRGLQGDDAWDLEVIDSDLNSEDYHCYRELLAGSTLTNMCKGSVHTEVEMGSTYSSTEEFNSGVVKREQAAKAKALTLASYRAKKGSTQGPKHSIGKGSTMGSTKPPETVSGGLAALRARLRK